MPLYPWRDHLPRIHDSCFIAPSANVIGQVEMGEGSSLWYHVLVRGDVNFIKIGKNTNIQDGCVIHVASPRFGDIPTLIGDNITIGHMALIHACTIHNGAFIGMKSAVMDRCIVEEKGYVAAGAVLTPGKIVKSGELWAGVPARKIRDLTEDDYKNMVDNTAQYVRLAQEHKNIHALA